MPVDVQTETVKTKPLNMQLHQINHTCIHLLIHQHGMPISTHAPDKLLREADDGMTLYSCHGAGEGLLQLKHITRE